MSRRSVAPDDYVATDADGTTVPGMTCIAFLSMDSLDGFVCYDNLVSNILEQRGVGVDVVSWRSADVRWNQYAMVVQRSSWDYQQSPDGYLQALEVIESSGTRLWNSLALSRWNIRKTYLRDMEQRGVTIVPTRWLDSPSLAQLQSLPQELCAGEVVVKPVIGANADHAFRLHASSPIEEWHAAETTYRNWTALAQPFLPSITSRGEISLIYFGNRFSHAVKKLPKSGDFRVQEEHGGIITPFEPDAKLLAFADQCLETIPEPTLYARVDVVFLDDDRPAVMEVELLEPSLYLTFDPLAAERFADAIVSAL